MAAIRIKFPMPGSVRRALVVLLAVVIVPMILIQVGVYAIWFNQQFDLERQANIEYARALAGTFDIYVTDVSRQESAIGMALPLFGKLPNDQANAFMRANADQYQSLLSFNWAALDGRVLASNDSDAVGLHIGDRDYFKRAIAGEDPVVAGLIIGRAGSGSFFMISRATRDADGRATGVIYAAVRPTQLTAFDIAGRRSAQGSSLLFDNYGNLVHAVGETEHLYENWTGIDDGLKEALAGREYSGFFTNPGETGRRIVARVPIGKTGWVAGAGRPVSEITGTLLDSLFLNLMLLGLIALLSGGAAYLFSRQIVAALGQLGRQASAIGGGDFAQRVERAGFAETDQLAAAFNRMAAQIQERTAAEARALAELQRVNGELADDVARRTRVEDALRRSEAVLAQAGYMARLGAWEIEVRNQENLGANELRWSDEVYRIFGYEPGGVAVTNKLFFERVHPEDRKRVSDAVAKAIARGKPYEIEHRIVRPDGAERVVLERAQITFDESGRPVSITGAVQDITEHKQREERLREAMERLRFHMENSPLGFVEWNKDLVITGWNEGAARIFGWSAEEMVGRRVESLRWVHEEDVEQVLAMMKEMTSGRRPRTTHANRNYRKDGQVRYCQWYNSALFDAAGSFISVMSLVLDVTDRQRSEEALRRRSVELEAANKELESFAYSVSHDLRAPLRSIDGFSQALADDYGPKLDDTAKDYIHRVRAASQRMGNLIDDLLKLSRVTRVEMICRNLDLSEMARSIAEDLARGEPARKVEFDIAPGVVVRGDTQLLRSAMENLLGNAWKFTSGKPSAVIRFGVDGEGADRVYYVNDNGAGFDMAYVDKLFAPFQRLHSTSEFAGTGIGLATVARVIHRHGGRIWAEGAVGGGATFYFTLWCGEGHDHS